MQGSSCQRRDDLADGFPLGMRNFFCRTQDIIVDCESCPHKTSGNIKHHASYISLIYVIRKGGAGAPPSLICAGCGYG